MPSDARVIGVISGKGGVGKTIVAINLAAALQKYNKKVLLVDLNLTTPHVSLYLGFYSTPVTLNDVLQGNMDIKKCIYQHSSKIDIIPSSIRLEDMKDLNVALIKQKIDSIKNEYAFIILDSATGFVREALLTLNNCSDLILVTNPIIYSAADLIKCNELAKKMNVKSLGVVVNMIRNKKYEMTREEIERMVGLNVISSIPYDDRVIESIVAKTPAINISPRLKDEFMSFSSKIAVAEEIRKGGGF